MTLLPPQESATPDALANELERMLDRGVPPLAIGQWVAVNQSALLSALRMLTVTQLEDCPRHG